MFHCHNATDPSTPDTTLAPINDTVVPSDTTLPILDTGTKATVIASYTAYTAYTSDTIPVTAPTFNTSCTTSGITVPTVKTTTTVPTTSSTLTPNLATNRTSPRSQLPSHRGPSLTSMLALTSALLSLVPGSQAVNLTISYLTADRTRTFVRNTQGRIISGAMTYAVGYITKLHV